jgi:hypothetical protein
MANTRVAVAILAVVLLPGADVAAQERTLSVDG